MENSEIKKEEIDKEKDVLAVVSRGDERIQGGASGGPLAGSLPPPRVSCRLEVLVRVALGRLECLPAMVITVTATRGPSIDWHLALMHKPLSCIYICVYRLFIYTNWSLTELLYVCSYTYTYMSFISTHR